MVQGLRWRFQTLLLPFDGSKRERKRIRQRAWSETERGRASKRGRERERARKTERERARRRVRQTRVQSCQELWLRNVAQMKGRGGLHYTGGLLAHLNTSNGI